MNSSRNPGNLSDTSAGYPRLKDIDRFLSHEMSVPEMTEFIKPLVASGKVWHIPTELMQLAIGLIAYGSVECPNARVAEAVTDLDRIYAELEY